jgi:rubredoxin
MTIRKGRIINKTFAIRTTTILILCLVLSTAFVLVSYAASCPKGGEHKYTVKLVKQASNTEDGLRTYTCKKCGHSYDEVIPNFGHEWSEWSIKTTPKCNRTGIEERHCLKCDAREERRIDSLGHKYKLEYENEASCTEVGYRHYKCSRCGHSYDESTSAALGHDWGEWEREGDNEVRVCKRDSNHTEKRAAPVETEEIEEEEEKPLPVASTTDDTPSAEHDGSKWGSLEWTTANTVVAAGGSVILVGLGALLFTGYITPWLWVLGKRRKKREEMQRRAYS